MNLQNSISLSLLDSISLGVQVIDFDFRYLYLNQILLEEIQMTSESIIGSTMMEKFPGIEETDIFLSIKAVLQNKLAQKRTNEFHFPDGRRVFYELEIHPVDIGVIIFTKDITETEEGIILLQESNKKLEQKVMERTLQLEELNQTLEQKVKERTSELEHFAYIAAHDLRRPCLQMKALIGIVNEDFENGKTEQLSENLNYIRQASRSMLRLIDGFRSLTNIHNAKLNREKVSLGELFDLEVQTYRSEISTLNVENQVVDQLEGYKELILLLLRNLIENAVKHGSHEKLGMNLVFKKVSHLGQEMYCMGNTFYGKLNSSEVVKPFVRGSSEVDGSGLGLSICKRVIDYHGGRLEVESTGNEFNVFFTLGVESA